MRTWSSRCCWLLLLHALVACGDDAPASHDDAGPNADGGDAAHPGSDRDGGDRDAGATGTHDAAAGADRDGAAGTHADAGDAGGDVATDDAGTRDAGGDAGPDAPPYRHPEFALRTIASGYAHACAITTGGALYCWGQNSFGQLGLGDMDARETPVRVGEHHDWSAVASGRYHTCAIRNGLLYCWGANGFSQLALAGVEAQPTPAQVVTRDRVWTAVTAGDWHTCALDDQGAVFCWGYELLGRLGNGKGLGTMDDPGEPVVKPTGIDKGTVYVAIDAGASHTCGVREDGELWCWGLGDRGQLGAAAADACELNTAPAPCSLSPVRVSGDQHWARVAAGGAHTCALTDGDALYCFGDNAFGQLGLGDDGDATEAAPQKVDGRYTAASTGTTHTCAVRRDQRLVCFGNNESQQLGLDAATVSAPQRADIDATFSDVSAGALCTCAVGSYGAGFCWGSCSYSENSSPSLIVTM